MSWLRRSRWLLLGAALAGRGVVLAQTNGTDPENRVAFHFEASSSRLLPGESAPMHHLMELRRAAPEAKITVLLPVTHDVSRTRFLAARVAELERQLTAHGIVADHQTASPAGMDGDLLWVAFEQPAASVPIKNEKLAVSLLPPVTAPAPEPAPVPPTWSARAGRSLRDVLQDWAGGAGWTVVWQSGFDYPLEASADFTGDFATVVTRLVGGFAEAKPAPDVHLYRQNQVVLVR